MSNGRHAVRKAKQWSQLLGFSGPFVASTTGIGTSLDFTEPATVIRMLGDVLIISTPGGTFVQGDQCGLTVAIGVVSTDAVGVGATAMPDPSSEPEFPWLFWKDSHFILEAAPPDLGSPGGAVRFSFDIRSMRKIKPRESLVWVFQYEDLAGAPPYTVSTGLVRVLLALD